MAKQHKTEDPKEFEKIESSLTKAEQYIEDNQKKLTYIVGILILVIGGFFAYKNIIVKPKEAKAADEIWMAQRSFAVDSFQVALQGDELVTGFDKIIDKYGSTNIGNTAELYAGISALQLGEYDKALAYLEDFSTDEPFFAPIKIKLIGDVYSQKGDYEKAASYYEEAANMADSKWLSPAILLMAGQCYEKLENNSKALEVYTTIKEEYPTAQEARGIEKYIARVN